MIKCRAILQPQLGSVANLEQRAFGDGDAVGAKRVILKADAGKLLPRRIGALQ